MDQGAAILAPADRPKPAPPLGDTVLAVRGVSKQFKIPAEKVQTLKERVIRPRRRRLLTFEALKNVSLDVKEGEFIGVVGRNGSGKSTLLKCIAGVYRPSSGTIGARGRIATFIELGVGFNPELDAHDNVILNATLLGLTASEAREKFDEIIAFAELEEFVELKLKNYSSGMQVRLAFSVAIQTDADILLIDEVLAVGDAAFQQKCFDVFDRLRAEGRTVIFVTHGMTMVERFCTRAIMLERGEQVAEGKPVDVARRYTQLNFDRSSPVAEVVSQNQGDEAATILECWVEDKAGSRNSIVEPAKWFTVRTKIKFNATMETPVFGISIRNDEGSLVFYANTRSSQIDTGRYEIGDEVTHEVRLGNCLGEGKYHLSPSVEHSDGGAIAALRESIASFMSSGERRTAGSVDLPFEQSIIG